MFWQEVLTCVHRRAHRPICYVFYYHRCCARYVQSQTPSIGEPFLERMAVRDGQEKMVMFDPSVIAHSLFSWSHSSATDCRRFCQRW